MCGNASIYLSKRARSRPSKSDSWTAEGNDHLSEALCSPSAAPPLLLSPLMTPLWQAEA